MPHHRSGHRVDLQNMFVRSAFSVAEGRIAANIFPGLEGGQLHRLDFVAGVPGIEVIHDIFQNNQHFIVLADGVYPVVQGNEAAAEGWKNEVGIFARFDVITAEPTEVFGQDQIDFPVRRVLHQPVKPRTVESRTGDPVVTVVVVERPALFQHIPGEHFLLIFD